MRMPWVRGGEELKAKTKIYQIAYCDCRPWDEDFRKFVEWTEWYVLECPLIGIKDLETARFRAKQLKQRYSKNVQVLIIGEILRKTCKTLDADHLYGITALRGLDAREEKAPEWIFEREEIRKEIQSRSRRKENNKSFSNSIQKRSDRPWLDLSTKELKIPF